VTLDEFYVLVLALPIRFRFKVAQAIYRYQDLRDRGATRGQARAHVEGRRDLLEALLLAGLLGDFRTVD